MGGSVCMCMCVGACAGRRRHRQWSLACMGKVTHVEESYVLGNVPMRGYIVR